MWGEMAVLIAVRAHPRAAREKVVWADGVLHAWVAPPAEDGRANHALIRLIGRALGVPPSRVRLVRGARGRDKVVEVDGLDALPVELTNPPGG